MLYWELLILSEEILQITKSLELGSTDNLINCWKQKQRLERYRCLVSMWITYLKGRLRSQSGAGKHAVLHEQPLHETAICCQEFPLPSLQCCCNLPQNSLSEARSSVRTHLSAGLRAGRAFSESDNKHFWSPVAAVRWQIYLIQRYLVSIKIGAFRLHLPSVWLGETHQLHLVQFSQGSECRGGTGT